MLRKLIKEHGKEKINTLTKYPSILTLHKLGKKGRPTEVLTTNISGEKMFATEKIDGTNVRIICWGKEFLIGSRKCILHYSEDLYWDQAIDIVNQFYRLNIPTIKSEHLTIIYGELFGGKITGKAKNYGVEDHGFRVFDVAVFKDLSILEKSVTEISAWREGTLNSSIDDTLRYGQPFVDLAALETYGYNLVPKINFELNGFDHKTILEALHKYIPKTRVALTKTAQLKPEGIILRNFDRTKIVKLRFEDYHKSLVSYKKLENSKM
jgi:RNA ligase.